jgi:molybdenum cofactor cytidylyltransferase
MGKIAGVVLAAGASNRLGRPKQLVVFNGETLVHAAVRSARDGGCEIVCVVTGNGHDEVTGAVTDLCPLIVRNDDWSRGIGTSIRSGVQAIADRASAVVLLACDQPAVDPHVVRSLIDLYDQTGCRIVASRYAETVGIPALFDRSCFAGLQHLPDQQGAKRFIEIDQTRVAYLDFPEGVFDVDVPADVDMARD